MRPHRAWLTVLLLPASLLGMHSSAAAQALRSIGITPTYQRSFQAERGGLPGRDFQAWGLMVGLNRSGAWWNPHVWYRRYNTVSYLGGSDPEQSGDSSDGWLLSVGPALEFLSNGRWKGEFLPQVGFSSRSSGELNGGAGIHLAYKVGFFQPQAFGRFEARGSRSYWTMGLGMTVEFVWDQKEAPPGFWRR